MWQVWRHVRVVVLSGSSRGQSMLEFALVAGFFFFVLMTSLTASLYAFEIEAATGGAEVSVRTAAGATQDQSVAQLGDNTSALKAAEQRAIQVAQPGMLGIRLRAYGGTSCANYQAPQAGDVVVCAYNETDANGQPTGLVTVRLKGRVAILVGAAFGFNQGVPIDVHESIHRLTFQR